MTNWRNRMQPSEAPQPDQSSVGQPPLPPQSPEGQAPMQQQFPTTPPPPSMGQQSPPYQFPTTPPPLPMGQQSLPHQFPTTTPLQPPPPPMSQLPQQFPRTHPLQPPQFPTGQLSQQYPMTNPSQPPPPPMVLPPPQYPMTNPPQPPPPPMVQQPQEDRLLTLRKRYNPKQIYLYFSPYPDRGPKIRDLQKQIDDLIKLIDSLNKQIKMAIILTGLILAVLLVVFAGLGLILLGLLALGVIIVIGFRVRSSFVKKNVDPRREELNQKRNELNQELELKRAEDEDTQWVQPPHERQYDDWISEISNCIHDEAPDRLHISKQFSTSLSLEGRGRMAKPNEREDPSQHFQKWTTRNSPRVRHYTVYEFSSLFVAEDYIAIYTITVNLRDWTKEREKFEYGYHRHLSHVLLSVDTDTSVNNANTYAQIKESNLTLTLAGNCTIERNISTLVVGKKGKKKVMTGFDNDGIGKIHAEIITALIDHGKSMVRSIADIQELG